MRLESLHILGLMLGSLAVALTAWAESERPQCPSEQLGACFVDDTGAYSGVLRDSEGDRITTSGIDTAEGNDRFLRILPDGTEVLHVANCDVMMVFCPADVPNSDYCFTGAGRVSAMATGRGSGCPTTVHMHGAGTDAFVNEAQFTGKYVNLPAPDGGCTRLFLEVEGSLLP